MDELARLLSVERRLLELLLFKLVEGRHLLAAAEARFLFYAAAEVERAMERVQAAELRRSMLVSGLARELEIPEESLTLSALARDSLEPYRTIFTDHRLAFLELAAEIEDVTRQNRRLAERGAPDVAQLMVMIGQGSAPTDELNLYGNDHGPRRNRDARLTGVGEGLAIGSARTSQLEAARDAGLPRLDTIRQHRSSLEDADMAETVMDLQMTEIGYLAVLGAVSRLSMPSLLDFLR